MKKSAEYIWFRLWRTNGIGHKAFAFAYNYLHSKSVSIMEMTGSNRPKLVKNFPELKPIISKLNPKDKFAIIEEYNNVKKAGLTIIHPDSEYYPENFIKYVEQIGVSPIFFCKGNPSILKNGGIAVVGSRGVSKEGLIITKNIASKLTKSGKNIVSGYAKGVDTAAHIGALDAGGITTLVLSYGINEFRIKREFRGYDFKNDVLVVTQFMPDEKWMARRAMARNKLICALSEAVIAIESGPERDEKGRMSGTFDSARTALKLGDRLFVLSPSALKEQPIGNSDIIKIGGQEILPDDVPDAVLKGILKDKEDVRKKELAQMEFNFGERGAVEKTA
jgi:DNA processing protein